MALSQLDFPLLTVREFLEWPSIARGQPRVVAGHGGLDRQIRWVHSSEIRDIAPLLTGSEVLLTTGLGLAGSRAATQERYIASLANKNIAALVLELGRSFSDAPPSLISAARAHNLPLILLDSVVPFVAITKEANARALNASQAFVESYQECTRSLFEAINGDDPDVDVIAYLQSFCGGPVRVLPAADVPLTLPDKLVVPIKYRGTVRCCIELPAMTDSARRAAIIHSCEHALPVWHRTRTIRPVDRISSLIEVLMRGECRSNSDVSRRLAGVGLPISAQHCCIPAIMAGHGDTETLTDVVRRIKFASELPAVAGSVGDVAYVLAMAPKGISSWQLAETLRLTLQETCRSRGLVGTPCSPAELSSALSRMTDLLNVSSDCRPQDAVIHIEQLSTMSLLINRSDADLAVLSRPVDAIARRDAVKGTRYLDTLDAFLDRGGHVSDVAAALDLTRQSLYQRLARISDILGAPLSGRGRFEALRTAVTAAKILKARAATVAAHDFEIT